MKGWHERGVADNPLLAPFVCCRLRSRPRWQRTATVVSIVMATPFLYDFFIIYIFIISLRYHSYHLFFV